MYYVVLIAQLFINIALCSQSSRDTDTTALLNQTTDGNIETEEHPTVNNTHSKVQLKVYYETLCPASVHFFVEQLKPAVKKLNSHLDIHLIPYGFATTFRYENDYVFRCQHGAPECYCNKVHACAIDVIRNNTHATLFNACLMEYNSYRSDYKHFVSVLRWCCRDQKVQIHDIWTCMNSTRGSNLLKAYGEETHDIPYIPFMVLDGSSDDQYALSNILVAKICNKLEPMPEECIEE